MAGCTTVDLDFGGFCNSEAPTAAITPSPFTKQTSSFTYIYYFLHFSEPQDTTSIGGYWVKRMGLFEWDPLEKIGASIHKAITTAYYVLDDFDSSLTYNDAQALSYSTTLGSVTVQAYYLHSSFSMNSMGLLSQFASITELAYGIRIFARTIDTGVNFQLSHPAGVPLDNFKVFKTS